MRAMLLAIAALFLAGCASAPVNTTAVYDHKYNTYSFVKNASQGEFVGTSAAAAKATQSWSPPNTTAVYDHKNNTYSFVPK